MTEARKVIAGWSCTQPFHDCTVEPGTCADCLKMADERLAALAAAGMEIRAKDRTNEIAGVGRTLEGGGVAGPMPRYAIAAPTAPPPGVLSEAEIAEIEARLYDNGEPPYHYPDCERLIASHRMLWAMLNAEPMPPLGDSRKAPAGDCAELMALLLNKRPIGHFLAETRDAMSEAAETISRLVRERDALKQLWTPISEAAARELKMGTMPALLDCPDDMDETKSGAHRLAHLVVAWATAVRERDEARRALTDAAIWFDEYAMNHWNKANDEDLPERTRKEAEHKAEVNEARAAQCRAALNPGAAP